MYCGFVAKPTPSVVTTKVCETLAPLLTHMKRLLARSNPPHLEISLRQRQQEICEKYGAAAQS
jgi:hypothetical protein